MFSHGFAVFNDGLLKGALSSPPSGEWLKIFVLGLYVLVLTLLWFYGLHRYHIMWLFGRTKKSPKIPPRQYTEAELPVVTVQLAVFNEMYVVERIIDAVCKLDYPKDRLEIQVLDDSTDETVGIARARVNHWKNQGFDIHHIHRQDRKGFKAGALAAGLQTARGEFIAMFDADFVPTTDFIRRQIHQFTDPVIGFVQARWGHINENHSLLTKIQALFLNGHFILEHTARQRSNRFFTFSGTAGMWRRECIETSGGWQHDTLVEDADLSYRAQIKGWRGVYMVDQVVPAELPVDMNAFKTQQHRWAKGFIQAMLKLLGRVWKSDLPLKVKIEAVFHLTNNLTYPLMVLLSLLMLPALHYRTRSLNGILAVIFDISLFLGATVSVMSFYIYAERQVDKKWWKKLLYMPLLMSVGIGMCLNQSKAVFEALMGQDSPFVRTPKYLVSGTEKGDSWKDKRYAVRKNMLPVLELAFTGYFVVVVGYAIWKQLWLAVPFLGLFLWGFGFVGLKSVVQRRRQKAVRQVAALHIEG